MTNFEHDHGNFTISFMADSPKQYVNGVAKRLKEIEPSMEYTYNEDTNTISFAVYGNELGKSFNSSDHSNMMYSYDTPLSFIDVVTRKFPQDDICITGAIFCCDIMGCYEVTQRVGMTATSNSLSEHETKEKFIEWVKAHDLQRCIPFIENYVPLAE